MANDMTGLEKAASQGRENQLRFLVNVVARHWKLIAASVPVAVLGYFCFVQGYALFFQPPAPEVQWRAQTQLVVQQAEWEKEIFRSLAGTPLFRGTPTALAGRISARDLAADAVHAMVQDDLLNGGLMGGIFTEESVEAAIQPISSGLEVVPEDETGVIGVLGAASGREEARRIVDYAGRSFIERNQRFLSNEEQEALDFVHTQLKEVGQRLDQAESDVWQFKKEMGFTTGEQYETDLSALYDELRMNEASRSGLNDKLQEIANELKLNNEKLPEALGQINDAVITGLLNQLNTQLQEQFTLSVTYTPEFDDLKNLQADIEDTQRAILEAVRKLDGEADNGQLVWDRRQFLHSQYRQCQIDLTSLEIRASTVETRLDDMMKQWPVLSEKRKQFESLQRASAQFQKQFDLLVDKKTELEDAIRRGAAPVKRGEYVTDLGMTKGRESQHGWLDYFIAAVIGLLAGLAISVAWELNDTSIRSVEDVTEYIGLDVIGMIPRMQFGRTLRRPRNRGNYVAIKEESEVDACIVTQHDPKSPISEAYRTLRTNFQFATIQQKPKTILVTSAVPGEGKTTTAVNMAVTFADSGFKVLLVDTDLRRPHVHHVLKMQRGPGLADVLRQGLDYHPLVRQTRIKNLWSISSGHVPPNPSELIGSERMRNVMQSMASHFDLVICDAPSVLVVTDPVLLATNVDAVVIVASATYARRETVLRAKRLMETAKAHIAGVVLNGIDATRRHYYYYYYYYDESASGHHRKRWFNS